MSSSKKRVMRKFKLGEISSVTRPAQGPALAVIMKNEYNEEAIKGAFFDSLKAVNVERAIWDDLWKYNDALREAIHTIFEDSDEYPDPVASVKEALDEFASAVSTMIAGAVMDGSTITSKAEAQAAITVMGFRKEDPITVTPELIQLLKSFGQEYTVPPVEENPMTPEELKKMEEMGEALKKANAIIALSATERAHFDKCDDAGKEAFLKMDAKVRSSEIAKAADADPVIYTSDSGEEFRKSDDPRLVKMAKQGDEDRKVAKAEREAREAMVLAKRAEDELGNLPGEVTMKSAVLKAIDTITDESVRKAAGEMLKAANDSLEDSFVPRGTAKGADAPTNKLEQLTKARMAADPNLSYAKAYSDVLETAEGKALYEQTL